MTKNEFENLQLDLQQSGKPQKEYLAGKGIGCLQMSDIQKIENVGEVEYVK